MLLIMYGLFCIFGIYPTVILKVLLHKEICLDATTQRCMARNFNQHLDIYRIPQLSEGLLAGIRGFSTHISQYHQVISAIWGFPDS